MNFELSTSKLVFDLSDYPEWDEVSNRHAVASGQPHRSECVGGTLTRRYRVTVLTSLPHPSIYSQLLPRGGIDLVPSQGVFTQALPGADTDVCSPGFSHNREPAV